MKQYKFEVLVQSVIPKISQINLTCDTWDQVCTRVEIMGIDRLIHIRENL